jgi:hypothetical protein
MRNTKVSTTLSPFPFHGKGERGRGEEDRTETRRGYGERGLERLLLIN